MSAPEIKDPYAPPPRHKDKSGAVVRAALLVAMLGGAAWGYMSFANAPQTASLIPAEEQTFAEARAPDGSYQATTPEKMEPTAPAASAPATSSAPASRAATPTPAAEPVPPPATTSEPTAPLPPIESPSGD